MAQARWGTLLFVLIACACAGPQNTASAAAPRAPAFAVARHAVHPWSASDRARLTAALAADFSNPSVAGDVAVAVVGDDGSTLFDLHGDRAMTPASTMKLLVGSTSFFNLGPAYEFVTAFESLEPPGRDGTLGDLWLVGSGDPVLTSDDLARGVGMLRRAGVRAVRRLDVDASAFTGPEQNPAWLPDDDQYDYAAGTSAISLDWDVVKMEIDGAQVFRPVVNIPAFVAGVARRMLRRAGIEAGSARLDAAPLVTFPLWVHHSPKMDDMVHQMFVESDNHIAEQLLRALGAESGIGTDATGARVERRFLAALGVPTPGLRIVDGSGLAPSDRVAPRTLATLLSRLAVLQGGQAFVPTLARAGIEGTVRYHQLTDAAGRVRAKSGHIGGVDSLAGYVQTRGHGRVAFSFIANAPDLDDEGVERTYDLALDQLSDY